MKIKLVADSSANIVYMDGIEFTASPLKVIVGRQDFPDTPTLDIAAMHQALKEFKGTTSTACPSIQDWLDAFGDADIVYGVSITSGLSASYSIAQIAAREYMEAHPGRQVYILDALSTGPEMELILEKYRELVRDGLSFDGVCSAIREYSRRTRLFFSLESLCNFARNGRVSPVAAAAVGILGIRVVGTASEEGTLSPLHKCRGEKRALQFLLSSMASAGYSGGKARIAHTGNPEAAANLAEMILTSWPEADVGVRENRGLCSYYAEEGGILLGFET